MKRVGVLGFGSRISGVIRNVIDLAPDEVKLEAFYDRSEKAIKRVAESHPEVRACTSVEELVEMDELDWIFVGSFNAAHHGHAIPAINAGKHVFCEKPLATTKQHCLEVLAARRQHPNQAFAVGFVLRYSAFYRTVKQFIDDGKLGEIISLEFNETLSPHHGAAMHGNWRRHEKWAGPMLVEKCCHDMDIMHWLTSSRPARVASFGSLKFFRPEYADHNDLYGVGEKGYRYYDRGLATGFAVGKEENVDPFTSDKDSIDNQVAIMTLENGVNASFHYCMHSAQTERRFYLCGTRGTLRADVLTGTIEYTPVGWKSETESVKPISGDGHGGAERPMAQDILACMRDGTPMPTTVENGVEASFTSLAIDEARKVGQVVDMAPWWQAMEAVK